MSVYIKKDFPGLFTGKVLLFSVNVFAPVDAFSYVVYFF